MDAGTMISRSISPCLQAKILLCLLAGFLSTAWLPVQSAADTNAPRPQHVLILSSYHWGYTWTEDIVKGIREAFADYDKPIEFSYEYLDTKRYKETSGR